MRVRYAVKFTLRDKLRLRGPGRPRHGRRKASDTRRGFFRVVQPAGAEGAVGGLRAGTRLHDRAAIRVGAVGKHSAVVAPARSPPTAPSAPAGCTTRKNPLRVSEAFRRPCRGLPGPLSRNLSRNVNFTAY